MSELSESAGNALGTAIGTEYAAIWVYGLARAFCPDNGIRHVIDDATDAHNATRDTAVQAMSHAGLTPPVAQPAYDVGAPVTDQSSAIQALIRAESDCQTGWRAVLEATEGGQLRNTALDALTAAATRATKWRLVIGQTPAVESFPGQPNQSS